MYFSHFTAVTIAFFFFGKNTNSTHIGRNPCNCKSATQLTVLNSSLIILGVNMHTFAILCGKLRIYLYSLKYMLYMKRVFHGKSLAQVKQKIKKKFGAFHHKVVKWPKHHCNSFSMPKQNFPFKLLNEQQLASKN